MTKSSAINQHLPLNEVTVVGIEGPDCRSAISFALTLLDDKLSPKAKKLIKSTKVKIVEDLINSGAQTNAERKLILLDAAKNSLTLADAENLLVKAKILDPGDWTKTLVHAKNEPWSCLTYQLVHEFGHIIDGLSKGSKYNRIKTSLSPTKYGKSNPSETFAETFTYWAFDLPLSDKAKEVINTVIGT